MEELEQESKVYVFMIYSLVAIAIAVASIVGAWGLTKEALKEQKQ